MTKTRYGVDAMSEGDWLVRGTDDPMRALELIVGELDDLSDVGWDVPSVAPNEDEEPTPEAVADVADWCFGMLARARPGYYRKNPCAPGSWERDGEGWTWMLGYANGPARGAFLGVYFRGY